MNYFIRQFSLWALFIAMLAPTAFADHHGHADHEGHAEHAATAQTSYKEGKQYEAVVPPREIVGAAKGKIIVQEFFWYGCPHCYELEPYLERWEKPKGVEFVRLPAALGAAWQVHAYVYYTLEALDRLDLHPVFFTEIHEKKKRMTTNKQVTTFFAKHGIKKADFNKTLRSFLVDTQVKRADKILSDYELTSVPYLVVNGRYKVSPANVGSYSEIPKVLDYLVGLERKRLKK